MCNLDCKSNELKDMGLCLKCQKGCLSCQKRNNEKGYVKYIDCIKC